MYGNQMTPVLLFWDRDSRPHPSELSPHDLDRVVFNGTLAGTAFHVTLGGYIATGENDRQAAADNINSFQLAYTLLRAYPLDPVGPKELDECVLASTGLSLGPVSGNIGRLGSVFASDREYHLKFLGELQPIPTFCDAKALPMVVELGDKMARSGYQVLFSGFLNANAARGNGERIVAFVGFWLLVEMLVSEELTRYLKARNTQPTIIEASLRSWALYERVALLKKWNVSQPLAPGDPTAISRAELKEIRKLAGVRNRIMHAGERPSDLEVERASTLGTRAMWRFLRFAGITYGPYVGTVDAIQTAFATKYRLP